MQLNKNNEEVHLSGFWGHVGILLSNTNKYLWYPITGNTREYINRNLNKKYIVIPCMNNKVLILFMDNVKEIVLLDFDCDQPGFANWDPNVNCGEIPLVIYECLEEHSYDLENGIDDDTMSLEMINTLKQLIENRKLTDNEIYEMTDVSMVYYADGKSRSVNINFDKDETVTNLVTQIYEFSELMADEKFIHFIDLDCEIEININMRHISMLEVPLLKLESSINKMYNEIGMELDI